MKANFHKAKIDGTYSYVPDFMVPTEEGEVSNRKQPKCDQVVVTIKRAKQSEVDSYYDAEHRDEKTSRHRFDYDNAIANHVKSIKGMEAIDVIDGKSLLSQETSYFVVRDLMRDLYLEIMSMGGSSKKAHLSAGE